jgi:hypothetical protein
VVGRNEVRRPAEADTTREAVTKVCRKGQIYAAGNYHVPVHRVQGTQLYEYKEQEDDHGAAGIQEVLSALPEAPAPPRNQVAYWYTCTGAFLSEKLE